MFFKTSIVVMNLRGQPEGLSGRQRGRKKEKGERKKEKGERKKREKERKGRKKKKGERTRKVKYRQTDRQEKERHSKLASDRRRNETKPTYLAHLLVNLFRVLGIDDIVNVVQLTVLDAILISEVFQVHVNLFVVVLSAGPEAFGRKTGRDGLQRNRRFGEFGQGGDDFGKVGQFE